MRRSRVPIADKRVPESKKIHNSSQRKATISGSKVMRKNFSVNLVNTRSVKEDKTKESAMEGPTVPEGITIEQEREPRQLLQPGKGDGRKATADVRKGRGRGRGNNCKI